MQPRGEKMSAPLIRTTKFAKILGHKKKGGGYSHFIRRLRRYLLSAKIDVQWQKSDRKNSAGGRPLNFADLTIEHIESWLGYLHPRYIESFREILAKKTQGFTELFKQIETAFKEGIAARRAADKQRKAEAKLQKQQQAIAAPPQTKPIVLPKTQPAQPPIKPPTAPKRVVPSPYGGYVPYKPSFIDYPENSLVEVQEFYRNIGEEMPLFQGETISTETQLNGYRKKMKNEPLFQQMDRLLAHWIFDSAKQAEFKKIYNAEAKALGYDPIARFIDTYSEKDIRENKDVCKYFFVLWHIARAFKYDDWRKANANLADELGYIPQMEIWKKQYSWAFSK